MKPYFLVHGAWGAAKEFDDVASVLAAAGHEVVAVDLPGHGNNRALASEVTLDAYVEEVVRVVEDAGKSVVLAGHSMGGVVISRAAEILPAKIEGLIYITAILPAAGSTALDIMQSGGESELLGYTKLCPEDRTVSLDPDAVSKVMLNDVRDEAEIERLMPQFRMKQPASPLGAPIELSSARFGSVPKFYIRTTRDKVIPPSLQDRMIKNWKVERVFELDSGHFPFVSMPEATAKALSDEI